MDYSFKKSDIIIRKFPANWERRDLDHFLIDNKIGTPTRIKMAGNCAFVAFEESNFSVLAKVHEKNYGMRFQLAHERVRVVAKINC